MADASSNMSTQPSTTNTESSEDHLLSNGYFAFARIGSNFSLVQVSYATPISSMTPVDVKVFRHEFISIFRFFRSITIHPADITILETIDDSLTRYEEDGTVFLARSVMQKMSMFTASDGVYGPKPGRGRLPCNSTS